MKATALIICLALVPFVAAQSPVTAEPEPATSWWDRAVSWANGFFDTNPVDMIEAKVQVALDKLEELHSNVNDFLNEYEVPAIPEAEYPTAEQINADIQAKIADFSATMEGHMSTLRKTFENFDLMNLGAEAEPEPEPTPEPEIDIAPKENSGWSWW